MSVLNADVRSVKIASGSVTLDDIKKLIAADLGVDQQHVVINVRLGDSGYDGPGYSRQVFDRIEFEVKQPI